MLYRASKQRVACLDVIAGRFCASSASLPFHAATRPSLLQISSLNHINTRPRPPTCYNKYHQIRNIASDTSLHSAKVNTLFPLEDENSTKIPHNLSHETHKSSPNLNTPISPQLHNTLTTFLKHASQNSLSKTSTTYLGTRYEYLVQSHLSSSLSFSLTRTGGRGDFGIDLLGTWDLPRIIAHQFSLPSSQSSNSESKSQTSAPSPPIKVLIQCKRIRSRPSPNLIRELEGSTRGAPSSFRDESSPSPSSSSPLEQTPTKTLSILVCSQPATKGIREAMGKSPRGLMFAYIEEIEPLSAPKPSVVKGTIDADNSNGSLADDEDTKVIPKTRMRQLLWNRAAAIHCGLEGLDVGTRYVDGRIGSDASDKEVVLLWQGRPLDFNLNFEDDFNPTSHD